MGKDNIDMKFIKAISKARNEKDKKVIRKAHNDLVSNKYKKGSLRAAKRNYFILDKAADGKRVDRLQEIVRNRWPNVKKRKGYTSIAQQVGKDASLRSYRKKMQAKELYELKQDAAREAFGKVKKKTKSIKKQMDALSKLTDMMKKTKIAGLKGIKGMAKAAGPIGAAIGALDQPAAHAGTLPKHIQEEKRKFNEAFKKKLKRK